MKRIKTNLEVLSEQELLLIHDSALKILSEIGMKVPNNELLQMCIDSGCIVETESTLKIPIKIMEQFIEKMREKAPHKISEDAHSVYGYMSTQVTIVDYMTNERRYGIRDDNLKCIKLVDSLKNIPVAGAAVVPSDVPYAIADVVSIADIQKYSAKPGGTYILSPVGAKYIQLINELLDIRGGYLLESISPLSFKEDTLEMALEFARKKGGLWIAPMAMSSATAPVTAAGTLTLETAEVLGSCFLVNLMTGSYPLFSASCHSVDPKTMLCSFGSPNQALFAIASGQLARFYGIQGGCNTALTDALTLDFQGGFEKGVTAALSSLSGLAGIGCQGIVGADQGFSCEQLVIDNEWLGYLNYITEGFEVSEEFIGFDTIKEVGIAGNFLGEEHTVKHMRDSYWVSDIFNRYDWSNWLREGGKTVTDQAHEFVEQATVGYKEMEPKLDSDTCKELDKIVSAAYKEVEK